MKKFNCNKCGKKFWWVWQKFHTKYWIEGTYYSSLWKKGSIVINVAKFLLEDAIWKCIYKFFMKKTLNSLWWLLQKFHQSLIFEKTYIQTLNESHKTQDWNYKSQLIMKRKRFNCDQCGKNFARGCNLNNHEIDSCIEWTSPFLDLKFKKGHIQIVHEGVLIFPK